MEAGEGVRNFTPSQDSSQKLLVWQQSSKEISLFYKVWKFSNFSQILREINLEAMNFDFYEFLYFLKDIMDIINTTQGS